MSQKKPSALHIVIPVWGCDYTDLLTQYVLLTHLSPNNLPAITNHIHCRYLIYTTEVDAERIRESQTYRFLVRIVDIEIYHLSSFITTQIDDGSSGAKYSIQSACYKQALQQAVICNAALVMMNADHVFSDGFFATVYNQLQLGKRALGLIGLRTLRSQMCTQLHQKYLNKDSGNINVSSHDLARLALQHLHPSMQRHFWGPHNLNFHPSHLYWKVNDTEIIARAFHLHPIMLYPRNHKLLFSGTIDNDCLQESGLKSHDLHVERNNQAYFCCELSQPDHYVGGNFDIRSSRDLAHAYFFMGTPRNIYSLKRHVHICGNDDSNKKAMKRVMRQSNRIIIATIFYFFLKIWQTRLREFERKIRTSLKNFSKSAGAVFTGN